MRVLIPSYKRPDNVKTSKWLTSASVVVPESQAGLYKANVENVISIPDKKDGNISKKRNAILEMFPGEDILMMDDDISYVGYIEKGKYIKAGEDQFLEMATNLFNMCREIGTVLWGVNLLPDPRNYREHTPFNLSSVVLGPLMGIVNTDEGLRFDNDLYFEEDYDFSVQVLRKYRKLLRFNKWSYFCGHIKNKGGIVSMRTQERENQQNIKLQKKWGSNIVTLKRKTYRGNSTINPIVKVPIVGV